MEPKITEEEHERLCAYLFEELDEAERSLFEAELAASPELQAEREKLEASMALVREFAPAAPAALSSASREALTAAALDSAAPMPKLAWYRSPGLQVAAAAALAMVAFRSLDRRFDFSSSPINAPATQVARFEGDGRAFRKLGYSMDAVPEEEGLEALGYADARSKGRSAGGVSTLAAAPEARSPSVGTFRGPGDSVPPGGGPTRSVGVPARPTTPGGTPSETADTAMFETVVPSPEAGAGGLVATASGGAMDTRTGNADWFLGAGQGAPAEGAGNPAAKLLSGGGKDGEQKGSQAVGSRGLGSPSGGRDSFSDFGEASAFSDISGDGDKDGDFKASTSGLSDSNLWASVSKRRAVETVDSLRRKVEALEQRDSFDELEAMGYTFGTSEPLSDEERAELGELRLELQQLEGDVDAAHKRKKAQAEQLYQSLLRRLQRGPNEKPSMMYFRFWGDNGFEFPVHDSLSTFAAEADTASYTLARKTIQAGYLPQRAQIRTEEFVNYFTPDIAPPTNGAVFRIQHELAPSPFGPGGESSTDRWTLRVGVRGKVVEAEERAPLALTFVIDVSGSMNSGGRLELVKHALRLLAGELNEGDSIAIITFSNESRRVLEMQSVGNKSALERALFEMRPGGGTNAEAGLLMGYQEAVLGYTEGAVNRVVFLSDGVGNIGETNESKLLSDVKRAREKGIYLNTIGVGMGNHNDRFLEQLADGGDGLCNYIDSADEAERALVTNFTSAFQPIARDVKIQVEFDPKQVQAYRLLGYENRAIADVDFRNDKVDAGELGAGHQVVALYELVLGEVDTTGETPLATTRVRYKLPYLELAANATDIVTETRVRPNADTAIEIEAPCPWSVANGSFDGASFGFQKSALAAEFAEMLRRSSHAKNDSVSLLRYKLDVLAKASGDPEVLELAALVQLAQPQLEAALKATDPVELRVEELATFEWTCARAEYLGMPPDEVATAARRAELRASLRAAIR